MDDLTFLRNLAARGKVVLLADGTAVPAPTSVMDDESKSGAPFVIDLVSPEGVESGDKRTFDPDSIDVRELPIPLMWQWQLDDGHKTAVVVGRIDYIERVPGGLGNARGVFDTGPWGQEAERMVGAKMLRGVSGDYSNFDAEVEKSEDAADATPDLPDDGKTQLTDDPITVKKSKLVAATLVAKPAFEGCYIHLANAPADEPESADTSEPVDPDNYDYEDGVIEASVPITASALVAAGKVGLVERLERLEWLESQLQQDSLALTASAARERVAQHKMQRDRKEAIARVNRGRN